MLAWTWPAFARGPELHVEVVQAQPLGEFELAGFTIEADTLIGRGYGALASAVWPMGRYFSAGVSAGYYRTEGGTLFDFFDAKAELGVLPVHALVVARVPQGRLALSLEAGAGYTRGWLDAEGVLLGGFDLDSLDRSEGSASVLIGAGVDFAAGRNWGLRGGLKYHQTFTDFDLSENAVKFLMLTAGVRFGP